VGLLLLAVVLPLKNGYGQSPLTQVGEGLPYFTSNFTPDEYGAHHQNWAVVEDDRGVIYVANTHGVLEYDGSEWRLITVGDGAVVRSLDVDSSGRIYVGAAGEVGYLAPDSIGTMEYISLVEEVPADLQSFGDVWETHVTGEGVYFHTWHQVFYWSHGEMHVFPSEEKILTSFLVRGDLYLWRENSGLVAPEGDSLVAVSGFDAVAERPVYAMLPYGEEGLLIGTYSDGLFVKSNGGISRFDSELNDLLRENKLYGGARITEDLYAFATLNGGAGIIDREGKTHYRLDENSGLQDKRVYDLYLDSQGGLWIALYNGIARTVVPSPVAVFDERRELEGAVQYIARHNGVMYAATARGLFREVESGRTLMNESVRFQRVPGTPQNSHWSILSVGDRLLATSNDGVYEVSENGINWIHDQLAFGLHQSLENEQRVFVGLVDGIITLIRDESGWQKESRIEGVSSEVRSIAEDSTGSVWFGTRYEGVIQLDFPNGFSPTPTVNKFGVDRGLPHGATVVSKLLGRILVSTRHGVFRVRENSEEKIGFSPDSLVTPLIRDNSRRLLFVRNDSAKNIWLLFDEVIEMYEREADGSYPGQPSRQLTFPDTKILEILFEGETVWFTTKDGLLRYHPTLDARFGPPPSTLVRQVSFNGDSLLFGGTSVEKAKDATTDRTTDTPVHLAYGENSLRFSYAAPIHNKPTATRYQYMLEGFDRDWSPWTNETSKEYASLPEGEYRFRVRARTVNGKITDEGVFAFQVLSPWYRTWWAYGLYTMGLIGALYGYGRYRASVSAKKLEQERKVNERLKEANAELRRANRLKDEFLANISHELRTPLASILGFADVLDEELQEPQREFVRLIKQSGDRLYNTLDALLDLAKFRAGMVELDYSTVDVVAEIDAVLQIFEPKAREKELKLGLTSSKSVIEADLDTFCLERILTNLVGNAIKFTEAGEVLVSVTASEEIVEIRVTDTGIGIDEEFLPDIFEAFRQESSGLSRSHQGVGLGLAITKRIVELMEGEIRVDSDKGRGTEVSITFPRFRREQPLNSNGMHREVISPEA
jgi:signal transduction histidine kinase